MSSPSSEEGDGYLVLVENRVAENGSHLLMFDALRIAGGSITRLRLPSSSVPPCMAIGPPRFTGLPASRSTILPPQDAAMPRPEWVQRAQSQSKLSARAGSPPR